MLSFKLKLLKKKLRPKHVVKCLGTASIMSILFMVQGCVHIYALYLCYFDKDD